MHDGAWVQGEVVGSEDGGTSYQVRLMTHRACLTRRQLRLLSSDAPSLVTVDSSNVRAKGEGLEA
eukprot:763937-Hanusia_phi.AAC.8